MSLRRLSRVVLLRLTGPRHGCGVVELFEVGMCGRSLYSVVGPGVEYEACVVKG